MTQPRTARILFVVLLAALVVAGGPALPSRAQEPDSQAGTTEKAGEAAGEDATSTGAGETPAAEPAEAAGDEETPPDGLAEEMEDVIKGTYLGAGFVYGHEQFDDTNGRDVDDSPGFSAWIGHYFAPQAGVEVQWEWIDKFKIDDFFGGRRGDGDLETHALTVNARILPLAGVDHAITRYVQPFVRAGAGFIAAEIEDRFNNDTNDAAFVLRGGGGVQWMFTRRFSFNTSAEYVYPTESIEGIEYRYLSVTAAFQFLY